MIFWPHHKAQLEYHAWYLIGKQEERKTKNNEVKQDHRSDGNKSSKASAVTNNEKK